MVLIGGEGRRVILWMCWCINMLITSIFYILAFATTANLVKSYKQLHIEIPQDVWRAPVAAACLSGLLVLVFNVLSCGVLLKKSIQRRNPSFAYGFTAAMCFTLAFLCLLCGLVLDGFRDTVETQLAVKLAGTWSKVDTGTFRGTIGFAYLCFCLLLLFFFALVIFQGEVNESLGLRQAYGKMNDNAYANNMAQDPTAAMLQQQQQQQMVLGLASKSPLPGMPGERASLTADAAGVL